MALNLWPPICRPGGWKEEEEEEVGAEGSGET